jgi:hypothetical protein
MKLRSLVTVASVSQFKAKGWPSGYGQGLWEVLTIEMRGIEPGPNPDHRQVRRLNGWC